MRFKALLALARSVPFFWVAWGSQANAALPVDHKAFAARCDLFMPEGPQVKSHLQLLIAESRKLRSAKVPIALNVEQCKAVVHVISLTDGTSVRLESGYPTNADPDYKTTTYQFVPGYKSKRYWMFEGQGWESHTWLLVDKHSGRMIETTTECGPESVSEHGAWIVSVCTGAYENTRPTVYATHVGEALRWTEGLSIDRCAQDSNFSGDIIWTSKDVFWVQGRCNNGPHRAPVRQRFKIDHNGLRSQLPNGRAVVASYR